jgi:hypothetical protein
VNNNIDTTGVTMTDEHGDSGADVLGPLLHPRHEHATPDMYPRLWNVSAGFMVKAVVRSEDPARPEYVTVPLRARTWDETNLKLLNAISTWNVLWESAQFRRRYFDDEELPPPLSKVADQGDLNVVFVPRTESRYHEYAPLCRSGWTTSCGRRPASA